MPSGTNTRHSQCHLSGLTSEVSVPIRRLLPVALSHTCRSPNRLAKPSRSARAGPLVLHAASVTGGISREAVRNGRCSAVTALSGPPAQSRWQDARGARRPATRAPPATEPQATALRKRRSLPLAPCHGTHFLPQLSQCLACH